MTQVLVTGMPRSGTTLLDKLLSSHPAALVFSQPLPLLYVEVKRRLLQDRELGAASRAYPLNDMFRTNYYASEAFQAFLETFLFEPIFCREVLAAMVAFDGQYIKPADPFAFLEDYKASRLFDFVRSYVRWLADGDCPVVTGSKETFCEEYIPYFLANGATVIQLVRDPRDVVTSLNFGHGERFGGPDQAASVQSAAVAQKRRLCAPAHTPPSFRSSPLRGCSRPSTHARSHHGHFAAGAALRGRSAQRHSHLGWTRLALNLLARVESAHRSKCYRQLPMAPRRSDEAFNTSLLRCGNAGLRLPP